MAFTTAAASSMLRTGSPAQSPSAGYNTTIFDINCPFPASGLQ